MKNALLILLFATITPHAFADVGDFSLMLESGAVWQHRNDARIHPDRGSYVEFDEYDHGPFFHYRFEAYYQIADRHLLRAVVAPFSTSVTGTPAENVNFNDVVFTGGEALTVDYQFNSYRLGYAYRILELNDGYLELGATAKWRDAKIKFIQGARSRAYTNGGLVPLLYLAFEKQIFSDISFNFTVDASAASQGRAIDAAIKFRKPLREDLKLGLGVRSLEGGADNDKVFTFSWFNYALLDLVWEL